MDLAEYNAKAAIFKTIRLLSLLSTNELSVRIMSVNKSLFTKFDSPVQLSKHILLGPYSSPALYTSLCDAG